MYEINNKTIEELELIAREAVLSGGIAAMGYYRNAIKKSIIYSENKNASTEADVQATIAMLRVLKTQLYNISTSSGCNCYIYGEELDANKKDKEVNRRIDEEINHLGSFIIHISRTKEQFMKTMPGNICVLLDAIDGTTNFQAGLPIFCSAIAIFVKGKLRIGAIYDPHHHIVYYGSIGIKKKNNRVYMWHIPTGNNTVLTKIERPKKPLIATHITRSDAKKSNNSLRIIKTIAPLSNGMYMLNSGQLALAYVAAGVLDAFINNHTNIWDVAAGQVLIEAINGCVTDLKGEAIKYNLKEDRIGIIAANTQKIYKSIFDKIKKM